MPAAEEAEADCSAAYLRVELDKLALDTDGDKARALRMSLRALTKRRRASYTTPCARPATPDQPP